MVSEVTEGFRLSPQQRRLWRLLQDSQAYRAQCAILIEGRLDTNALKSALQAVVDRQEILRTSFQRLPGMDVPMQVIAPSQSVDYEEVDLSHLQPRAQHESVSAHLEAERVAALVYDRGPLVSHRLLRLSGESSLLLITLPALCADALTLRQMNVEIGRAYDAALRHEPMADEPVQYADLAEWQNELLESPDTAEGRIYWSKIDLSKLDLAPLSAITLAAERPPARSGFEPERLTREVEPALAERVEALAMRSGASLAEVALACWSVLVWRLQGADLIIGVTAHRRKYAELEQAIGQLSRCLPLSFQMEDACNFLEAIRQVSGRWREALEWEEYFSWEQGTKACEALDDQAFFPVNFEFLDRPSSCRAGEVRLSLSFEYACAERFNVKLACLKTAGSLVTEFHYDANRFAKDAISRLADRYHKLLESAARHPEAPPGQLDMLGDGERALLLGAFSRGEKIAPHAASLHRLIERQVERTPHNTAVVCDATALTYSELNARANRIARHLRRRRIESGGLVGVCMNRSIDMLAGLLGILKVGAAYVPIDPSLPQPRIDYILQDARVSAVLSNAKVAASLASLDPTGRFPIICVDDRELIGRESDADLDIETGRGSLAYVIYTSGSTGQPKGVMVSHGAICNRLLWGQSVYPLGEADRVLGSASPGFDFSVWEMFAPLIAGASVILPGDEGISDMSYLVRLIREQQVTTAHFVPSLLHLFLEEKDVEHCRSLRLVFSGGEALPVGLKERFFSRLSAELYNQYGPTEATVDATYYCCRPGMGEAAVPIGRPIARTQTYILDPHLQPVAIGAAGELHIGGECLALGYLGRPELTAEKFIPNPFSDRPGERLYKTADLARYLPDGQIEFLGRTDHQVKLRGVRIELGEVEAILLQHPGVREAVATVHEYMPGDRRLVAYTVAAPEQAPACAELQNFVRQRLPDFMVPSNIVTLASLPLLASGKVNRRALPPPDQAAPDRSKAYVAPQSPVEETLADLWGQVLGVERIGVHDNFFEMGGHSLMAMQLISRVRETFQVELPIRYLFEHSTVATLAGAVEQMLIEKIETMSEEEAERLLALSGI